MDYLFYKADSPTMLIEAKSRIRGLKSCDLLAIALESEYKLGNGMSVRNFPRVSFSFWNGDGWQAVLYIPICGLHTPCHVFCPEQSNAIRAQRMYWKMRNRIKWMLGRECK